MNLDAEVLRGSIAPETRAGLDQLMVFAEVDSTNQYLLDQPAPWPGLISVALAEHQTAGRGSRGRRWFAPPSTSICMSIAYAFEEQPRLLPSLSLAVGVAVVEVLQRLGVRNAALKWPNDILANEAKLGGILIEARGDRTQNPVAIAGLGLNIDLTGFDQADIAPDRRAPITDLMRCVDQLPSRERIAASLIDSIFVALRVFDAQGFTAFAERWDRCDWLRGRETTIETSTGRLTGAAEGVDTDGALLLMTKHGRRCVQSGSVVLPMGSGIGG